MSVKRTPQAPNQTQTNVWHLAEAQFADGVRAMEEGEHAIAIQHFQAALQFAPDLQEAYANLGFLHEQRGDMQAAENIYRQAIDSGAQQAEFFLNLGALLCKAKRFAESHVIYQRGLDLHPGHAGLWSNRGALYACQGHLLKAEQSYRKALALSPGYASASFNLATVLLQRGDFVTGWAYLEARNWYEAFAAKLPFPRWRGQNLQDKRILIMCEAGHGDMIQFCRYAQDLKAQGAQWVAVLCHPALKRLFTTLAGLDEIFALGEYVPPEGWDYWVPPLSLPFLFNTRLDTIPCRIPYVHAHAEDVARWCARLPATPKRRVGLVWKGSTKFENDAARSIPDLSLLAPLWQINQVEFVSLQKGAGEEQAHALMATQAMHLLGPALQDFADTAALIETLDLVISVDTAVAHLAGALGKPCWLLLPAYRPDWRWLNARSDSPWYPYGMRLFRQRVEDDWQRLIATVATALADYASPPQPDQH